MSDILAALRKRGVAKEKSLGVFYLKGKAWLHFHEDISGLHADIRPAAQWIRLNVSELQGRARLMELLADVV